MAQPGTTVLHVPGDEAPWVLESPLPRQVGDPEPQPDGSFLVRLDIAPHIGLQLWARGMGVEVVEGDAADGG